MSYPFTNLNDIAEDVSLIVLEHAPEGVCLDCSLSPENLAIEADFATFHQILSQLIEYAIQAVLQSKNEGKRFRCIELSSGRRHLQFGMIFVEIAFEGPALPDEVMRNLRQPFMIPRNEAVAFGLFGVREQVEILGGGFQVESPRADVGEGVRFRMLFPECKHQQKAKEWI